MKVTIDLVRHAESDWVRQQAQDSDGVARFGGRMPEICLSDEGKGQSRQLCAYADAHGIHPTVFCSSPAERALQTHRFGFGAALPGAVHLDDRLHELDWGALTNQPRAIMDTTPFKRARDGLRFTPSGGESYATTGKRVREALMATARRMGSGHLWAYTHKNAILGAVQPFMGWGWKQVWGMHVDLVSLTRLTCDGEHLRLVFFNRPTLG